MVSLGSFGTSRQPAPDPEPLTFDWFGSPVGVVLEFNQVELVDLMESMGNMDETDPRAMTIAKDMLRLVVQPEPRFRPAEEGEGDADILVHVGFDKFWDLAKKNWQTIADLGELSQTLMEAATNRPTQRPSDSSDGPRVIGASSPAASSSPARPGRPDIQMLKEDAERDRQRILAAV